MLDLCPRLFQGEVVEEFERIHGVRLTVNQVKQFRRTYGVRNVSGRKPPRKVNPGCFRPGERHGAAEGWEPVGSESLRADGYVYVKVSDEAYSDAEYGRAEAARLRTARWRLRSRVNYEAAYGPVPEGCYVFHADGDRTNDDPENLVAVPLRLRATITKLGNPYADRETLETAMLMAEVVQAASRADRGDHGPRPRADRAGEGA